MNGVQLLRNLIESTGLPPVAVEKEIQRLLKKHDVDSETVTLEKIRVILADYLQDVFLEAKAENSAS